MKKSINLKTAILLILSFVTQITFGQNNNSAPSINYYKTWIKPIDNSKVVKTYLRSIGNDSIELSNSLEIPIIDQYNLMFPIDNIKELKFREKGKVGKSIAYGALIGFGTGALFGFASGDDNSGWISFSAEEKALGFGILLTIPGAIIGAIAGTHSVKFAIKGDRDILIKRQKEILKYKSGL